jgi:hypothetical protein
MSSTSTDEAGERDGAGAGGDMITILGSLLSEKSCRVTFPNLHNFRLGQVPDYRRVFAHPASIFFQRGIANLDTLQMSSLSVEYDKGNVGFVVSVFQVPNDGMMMMQGGGNGGMVPSRAFLEREEEFDIVQVPYNELTKTAEVDAPSSIAQSSTSRLGIICTRSTDQAYIDRWGQDRFDSHYRKYGVETIWGYGRDSGLRPCAVYLRHCYLAATSLGSQCLDSEATERVFSARSDRHPTPLKKGT